MLARYVVSLVALEETIKNKVIIVTKMPTEEEMSLMLKVLFPEATKTLWSITLFSTEIEMSLN